MPYDPRERKYLVAGRTTSRPSCEARIVQDARTLVQALGYDMNSIEFAMRDGVPYAIDFMNPAPDMDIYSLTPTYFEWAVKAHGGHGDQAGEEAAAANPARSSGTPPSPPGAEPAPCRTRSPTTTSC